MSCFVVTILNAVIEFIQNNIGDVLVGTILLTFLMLGSHCDGEGGGDVG